MKLNRNWLVLSEEQVEQQSIDKGTAGKTQRGTVVGFQKCQKSSTTRMYKTL